MARRKDSFGKSVSVDTIQDKVSAATKTESLYVKGGWPSTGELYDHRLEEVVDDYVEWEENELGYESGLVGLAKNMDERCDILDWSVASYMRSWKIIYPLAQAACLYYTLLRNGIHSEHQLP